MTYEIWPPARRLDGVARAVAGEWGVALGERYPLARFSFAAPAGDAVLKVTPPEDDESDHEADALRLWDGDGAARLLRHDASRRALLIERAVPGHDASTVGEDDAVAAAMAVGRRLWRPVSGPPFRRAHDEVRRWLANVRATGHRHVAVAERVFASMAARDGVLVHGDFHHHNLLRHGERWVAIDPKPLIGEPEFDIVTFLWNPLGVTLTRDLVERRIAAFAAAGLEEKRVREWAIVRGVYLGLPIDEGRDESTVRQLTVARLLIEG